MKKMLGIVLAAMLITGTIPASAYAQTYTFSNFNELQAFFKNYNLSWNDLFGSYQNSQPDQQPKVEQEPRQPEAPSQEQETTEPAPVQSEPQPVKETAAESSLSVFEQQVVDLTNVEREKAGLAPLKIAEDLSDVARIKSEDMRDNRYFSHQSPTYGSPFDMMKQFGISYTAAGENIAAGQRTPEEVVRAWMNSEGHRKNILNGNFTHIGVGHAEGGSYAHYWTQQFIRK